MRAFDPRLLRYARATGVALAAAVAFGVVAAGLAIAQAALLGSAISAAFLAGAGIDDLSTVLAALALVLAARAAVTWGQESVSARCAASVKSNLRLRLVERAALPGPGLTGEPRSGEVVALVTRGLDALDPYFSRYLPQLALAAIVPAAVVVALAFVDWVAALTVALTVPLIPVFMALIGRATERRTRRRWAALARLSNHFLDVVAGLPTLRVFGRAHAQLASLEQVTDDYRRVSLATLRIAFLSAFALELLATLSVALVAVGVGLRLVEGSLDLRTGLFVLLLAPEAYLPLRQLGVHYHASEEGLAAASAAFAIIERPVAAGALPDGWAAAAGAGEAPSAPVGAADAHETGAAGAGTSHETGAAGAGTSHDTGATGAGEALADLPAGRLSVVAEGVDVVHLERDLAAPAGASFEAFPGEVLAITGPSGSGKSTLVAAVLGLLAADRGRILVGGIDLACADVAAWHRRVAWVPQHPFLFPGSVAENVRLAALGAADADVRAALAAVGLAALRSDLPLGEAGTGVSSGQRRRIGVARALLRGADVLLLDEPTAGLDAAAEATVLAAIRAAADAGATVILVAHRPAALAIADRVVSVACRTEPGSDAAGRRAAFAAAATETVA